MRKLKFIVLTTQRAGSSWFVDLLNQMPDTEGHMELFLPEKQKTKPLAGFNEVPRFCERPRKGINLRPFSTWNYLSDLYNRSGFVGFKLMYSHLLHYPEILLFLAFRRIAIIHLVRHNSLDIVISNALTAKLNSPHAVEGDKSAQAANTQVALDSDFTMKKIRKIEASKKIARRIIKWLHCPSHEISYEDLKSDPAVFRGICEFLGINPDGHDMTSRLKKRQTLPKHEAIINFHEIRTMLAKHNLEHFCH